MVVLPIPNELQSACNVIVNWAAGQRLVIKVYGFGSRFTGNHRPDSDIDMAIGVLGEDEGEILDTFLHEKHPWEARLTQIVGVAVDLDLAHPTIAPRVWSYLTKGCALIFER